MSIPEPVKAGWAVAYADQTRLKKLGPALRRAAKPGHNQPPDRAAMQDALAWAACIVVALTRGLEMLDE